MFTYVTGIIYENEAIFAPSKEKIIYPDGNCLFSSLSYIITGSDHYHKEIREYLTTNMKNEYRIQCTNYCTSHYFAS